MLMLGHNCSLPLTLGRLKRLTLNHLRSSWLGVGNGSISCGERSFATTRMSRKIMKSGKCAKPLSGS